MTSSSTESVISELKLPPVKNGEVAFVLEVLLNTKKTKPPRPYTEGDLQIEMESAAKFVEDPEMRKQLKATSGLGTSATRAKIIEDLKASGYAELSGKHIHPTEKGITLIDWLPADLASLERTAMWESYLEGIAQGKGSRVEFEKAIAAETSRLIEMVKLLAPFPMEALRSTKGSGGTGKPTIKQVDLARKIAIRLGKNLSADVLESFSACSAYIEQHKNNFPPTPRQISFAKDLTKRQGIAIPDGYLTDQRKLSEWISKYAPKKNNGLK